MRPHGAGIRESVIITLRSLRKRGGVTLSKRETLTRKSARWKSARRNSARRKKRARRH